MKKILSIIFYTFILSSSAAAQIAINELMAAPCERILQWDEGGYPHLGAGEEWNRLDFNDSSWKSGNGPFGFGTGAPGTVVQMQGITPSLYLRKIFTASYSDLQSTGPVVLNIDYNDGFIAYLNGREIARKSMGQKQAFIFCDQPAYTQHNSGVPESFTIGVPSDWLVIGENVLAIQVHSLSLSDTDLYCSASLVLKGNPDKNLILAFDSWKYFVGIHEPSGGISQLVLKGEIGKNAWTELGFDSSSWLSGPGGFGYGDNDDTTIVNIQNFAYSIYLRKEFTVTAEQAASSSPLQLVVDYDDGFIAYLNGQEIARRGMGNPGDYYAYNTPSQGINEAGNPETINLASAATLLHSGENVLAVQVHNSVFNSSDLTLKADLKIAETVPQELVRYSDIWQYKIGFEDPVESSIQLEPDFVEWVELLNTGSTAVDLAGWSLTDDREEVEKCVLPSKVLQPGEYVLVLMLGKPFPVSSNRYLTADFELSREGEYLGLFDNSNPRRVVSEFYPRFPKQTQIHSYGRIPQSDQLRYFDYPTPGAPNVKGASYTHIVPDPVFSVDRKIFTEPFDLTLSCPDPAATIRYTLDGSDPMDFHGTVYSGPIRIENNRVVRARAFKAQAVPSNIITHSYISQVFSKDPIVLPESDLIVQVDYGSGTVQSLMPWPTNAYPFELAAGQTVGQIFKITRGFTRIGSVNPTWGTTNASFKLTLYRGFGGPAINSITIVNAVDNNTNMMGVGYQPPGEYYLEISNLTSGKAGWWGSQTSLGADGYAVKTIPPRTGNDEALRSCPVLSVVSDRGRNLFEPHGALAIVGGGYPNGWQPVSLDDLNHIIRHGRAYERPVSIELIYPDGSEGFQTHCGIRAARSDVWRPGMMRTEGPWMAVQEKLTSRFYFRNDYGDETLNFPIYDPPEIRQFNTLAIRSGNDGDYKNPFTKDEFLRRISIEMGNVEARGIQLNLFYNGEFKNYYGLTENLDEKFFQVHFQSDYEWDILKYQVNRDFVSTLELQEGDLAAWNELFNFINTNSLANNSNYEWVASKVDLTCFIDYLIVNLWGGNLDWPWNNWVVARERSAQGKFRFHTWDADITFIPDYGINFRSIDKLEGEQNPIPILYRALKSNPEFKLLFADRIQRAFASNGPMSQANLQRIFAELRATVEKMIQHVYGEPYNTYIPNQWIPQRQGFLLQQFSDVGLLPSLKAPVMSIPGGEVNSGFPLTISNPNGALGTIYYTTNGSDPREAYTNQTKAEAASYTSPIPITTATTIKARVRNGSTWSPLVEGNFTVIKAVNPGDIIITEFMANPVGTNDDGKEWFEVFNTTNAPIDINGWTIADNDTDVHVINKPGGLVVPAKGHLVLGESTDPLLNGGVSVQYAYGSAFTLGNSNDEIILLKSTQLIHSIGYGAFNPSPNVIQNNVGRSPVSGFAIGMAADYCNDPVELWANQSSTYNNNGDHGTPGAANDGIQLCVTDTTPPSLQIAKFARGDLLYLIFDEPLDLASSENVSNYQVAGTGSPVDATRIAVNRVVLDFTNRMAPGINHQLVVNGIKDTVGNTITTPIQRTVRWDKPQVSITELMYNDRSSPDNEWIELHNTTDNPINLSGWYLTDDDDYPANGEGSLLLPEGTVLPAGGYLVVNLWNDPRFTNWKMPAEVQTVNSVLLVDGRLSDGGDNLAMFTSPSGGSQVDGSLSVLFPDLTTNAESIEKIDEDFPWGDVDTVGYNFRKATVPLGWETERNLANETLSDNATPGRKNGTLYRRDRAMWHVY